MTTSIPSHHNVGDPGHAADHNAMADALTAHDQAIIALQSTTQGIFYVGGGNVSNITNGTTIWAKINLPTGDRSAAPDTWQVFHGSNKIFWLDNEGKPRVKNDDPTHIPWVVDSVAGQTANVEEWRVNGTTVASMKPDGTIVAKNTTPGVWTDMTLNSGIVWYNLGHRPQYRITNDKVELRGTIAKSNGSDFTSSPVTVATLPSAAKPTTLAYNVVARQVVGSTMTARLEVSAAGSILIYFDSSNSPAWLALDNTSFSILPD